jgi:hypothetical protein
MEQTVKRATVYLDSKIHRLLKVKSLETDRSVSALVNEALRHEFLEDQEDIADLRKRADEPTISYEELLKKLKADGKI